MGAMISKKKGLESDKDPPRRKFSNTVTSNISSLFMHRPSGEGNAQLLSGKIVIRSAKNKSSTTELVTVQGDRDSHALSSPNPRPLFLGKDDIYGDDEEDDDDEDNDESDDNNNVDDDFPRFLPSHSSSMSRALTPFLWRRMRNRRTRRGFDINDCVQPGIDVPQHRFVTSAGCVAPEADAYNVFGDFFEKVVAEQHKICGELEKNVRVYDFPTSPTILRFAIKSRRNVSCLAFPPRMTRAERRTLRSAVRAAVDANLRRSLPIRDSVKSVAEFYAGRKCLFLKLGVAGEKETELALKYDASKPFSGFWTRAGVARDWPKYAEFYQNETGNRRIWVNDTDHVIVECACGGRRGGIGRREDEGGGSEEDDDGRVVGWSGVMDRIVKVGPSPSEENIRIKIIRENESKSNHQKANDDTKEKHVSIKETDEISDIDLKETQISHIDTKGSQISNSEIEIDRISNVDTRESQISNDEKETDQIGIIDTKGNNHIGNNETETLEIRDIDTQSNQSSNHDFRLMVTAIHGMTEIKTPKPTTTTTNTTTTTTTTRPSQPARRIQVTRDDAVRAWEEHTILVRKLELGLADNKMEWSVSEGGFLTTSPADLGAATRLAVWMHLPYLSKRQEFKALVTRLNLRAVGACGVDSRPILSIYRVENNLTFGVTEDTIVAIVVAGVTKLASAEEALAKGVNFSELPISGVDSSEEPHSLLTRFSKQVLRPSPPHFWEMRHQDDSHIKPEYPNLKSWSTLTSRVLTKELYGEMTRREKEIKGEGGARRRDSTASSFGALSGPSQFDDVIQCACDHDYVDALGGRLVVAGTTRAGCVALNADSYRLFGQFFDRILVSARSADDSCQLPFRRSEKRRKIFAEVIKKMDRDAEFLKEEGQDRVTSVRIRILRNIRGFDFAPAITRKCRRMLCRLLRDILLSSDGRLGKFKGQIRDIDEALEEITARKKKTEKGPGKLSWRQAHLILAAIGQRTTTTAPEDLDAGTPRDWPDSRHVWTSPRDDGVIILVNDEAHLKLVVDDVSLRRCVRKAALFYDDVERSLRSRGMEFCWDKAFGFLQASPAHLGNGARVSVELAVPEVERLAERTIAGEAMRFGVTKGTVVRREGGGKVPERPGNLCLFVEGKCSYEEISMMESLDKAVKHFLKLDGGTKDGMKSQLKSSYSLHRVMSEF